mmetsp:Transcript_38024/g.38372  ORF Transcript_38024/g.38372 Transcript_38024/m.38372 type:complete len:298 (-) Transcript_38024:357-1250(-)|eukprot:CAMPEP_0171313140 /NCGR_PEP_ID=MMETSP0816-20121228/38379_1 /TAXON_ID=420281 /ORGANISM="Proboscia inermis, Strain CCAP1064/1" /LENGTH=297 /DNA_ID=CAMNT_0011800025 /DNA_START=87 /DNA_END=980 /DNA_ORIENTATION=+
MIHDISSDLLSSMINAELSSGAVATLDTTSQGTGCVVIACRARAMPKAHNAMSAIFTVDPTAVSHGDELICSYDACRNCGVKFLWCKTCQGPVPKRNFKNRHSHDRHHTASSSTTTTTENNEGKMSGFSSSPKISSTSEVSSDISATFIDENPGKRTRVERENDSLQDNLIVSELDCEDGPSHFLGSKIMDEHGLEPQSMASASIKQKDEGALLEQMGSKENAALSSSDEQQSVTDEWIKNGLDESESEGKRAKIWGNLLYSRPTDASGSDMSKWLLDVIAISDKTKPVESYSAAHI